VLNDEECGKCIRKRKVILSPQEYEPNDELFELVTEYYFKELLDLWHKTIYVNLSKYEVQMKQLQQNYKIYIKNAMIKNIIE